MTDDQEITLQVSRDGIETFCRDITRGSANTGRKHATLVALEGFIARHAGADRHSPAYEKILTSIRNFSEQTRSKLLQEQVEALLPALQGHLPAEIGRIHSSLSRNGFSQVLASVWDGLPRQARPAVTRWISDWCEQAERAAREASGYPDAMNFRAADIELREYRAMKDILVQLPEDRA